MVENIVVLSMNVIVPIVLIITGAIFKKHIPANRNGVVGYRTKRSRSSQEAWEFANKEMANLMFKYGIIMLIASIVISAFFVKSNVIVASVVCTVVMVLQCLWIVACILIIEKKLKDRF